MIRGSLRGWVLAGFTAALLAGACGPPPPPAKCQASTCSGCCAEDNTCVTGSKQSFNACGRSGAKCRTCLPQQICSAQQCIAGQGGAGGEGGGGIGTGGGSGASGGGTGTGGGAACGASGETCCVGSGTGCLLGLFCVNNTCGTTAGTGGGSGVGGGSAGGGSGGAGGGSATGGGAGGGAAVDAGTGALGDPCVVNSSCGTNFCQAFGFQDGYCTKTCTSQADCPAGSACGRNPGGGSVCLKSCPTAGLSPGGCRTGYVCDKFQTSMDSSPVCFPACASAASCVGGALTCDARGFCCGVNGAACCGAAATCDSPNTCDAVTKHCKSLPATNRPAGEACTTNNNCAGNICITELVMPPACTQPCFAGGYCTQDCTSAACPAGSSCSLYTFGGMIKRCVSNCTWDGGQGDCRNSYVCDRYTVQASTQSTCYKKCFNDAGCPSTTACEQGFCCGAQGYRCCAGAVKCPSGGTCNSLDYCQ